MNTRKDINKEIDNYIKGNYPKNIAIELLKRDGFSESEINEHLHKLDIVDKNNTMTYMFVPGFLFILIASFFLLTIGTSSEENSYSTISLIGFIFSIPLIYFFYKGNKFSILITGFAIICSILFRIMDLFNSFSNIISTILIIIISWLILISVKNYYKSI
jgi:membrane-associated HD superfamily phosphohydrolase